MPRDMKVDRLMADELFEHVVNDGHIYRQRTTPIIRNLGRKMAKGVYEKEKAVKLWRYLVDEQARAYAREFLGGDSRLINSPTRDRTARELEDYYRGEVGIISLPGGSSVTRRE